MKVRFSVESNYKLTHEVNCIMNGLPVKALLLCSDFLFRFAGFVEIVYDYTNRIARHVNIEQYFNRTKKGTFSYCQEFLFKFQLLFLRTCISVYLYPNRIEHTL